jgi:hypothetical protein
MVDNAPKHWLDEHLTVLQPDLLAGRVVPFLGAGASTYARRPDTDWTLGCDFFPTASELAEHLAKRFHYPSERLELTLVAEWVALKRGRRALYDELHAVFAIKPEPLSIHRFFARLAKRMLDDGSRSNLLVVTTNYDDALERAFAEVGMREYEMHVVWYAADGDERGMFLHSHGSREQLIERSREYHDIDSRYPIVLKMHGSIDRSQYQRDSYVITMGDYFEYLMRADVRTLLPRNLVNTLLDGSFVFLGYGLRDWNLAVILHRMWGEQRLGTRSWAVRLDADEAERVMWDARDVEIIESDLGTYADALGELALG